MPLFLEGRIVRSIPQPEAATLRWVRPSGQGTQDILLIARVPNYWIVLSPWPQKPELVDTGGCRGTGGEVWGDLGEWGHELKHQGPGIPEDTEAAAAGWAQPLQQLQEEKWVKVTASAWLPR